MQRLARLLLLSIVAYSTSSTLGAPPGTSHQFYPRMPYRAGLVLAAPSKRRGRFLLADPDSTRLIRAYV